MLVVYWGPLRQIFGTEPLSILELTIALALASVVFWAVEADKLIHRRRGARAALSVLA
jgi:Ca2+-transporting ATPase